VATVHDYMVDKAGSDRQVASEGPALKLGDQSDSAALSLSGADDAIDLGCHVPEVIGGNGLIGKIDLVKSYKEGNIEIVIGVSAGPHASKHDLIFFAIPSGDRNLERPGPGKVFDVHSAHGPSDRNEGRMCAVTQLVEGPEGHIPSLVRLEPSKERLNLWGQVFGPSSNVIVHVEGGIPEREFRALGSELSPQGGYGESGLIERGPQRLKRFGSVVSADLRNGFGYVEFVKLKSMRVFLDNLFVWYCFEELGDAGFKFADVTLSPR
jgi:hypothetical protein